MTTQIATKKATINATQNINFCISFNKKALTKQAVTSLDRMEKLRQNIVHPIMGLYVKNHWRKLLVGAAYQLTYGTLLGGSSVSPLEAARLTSITALFDEVEHLWLSRCEHSNRPELTLDLLERLQTSVLSRLQGQQTVDHLQTLSGINTCSELEISTGMKKWFDFVSSPACLQLASEYRSLIATYYLQRIHPFGHVQALMSLALLVYGLRYAGFGDMAEGVVAYFAEDAQKLATVYAATRYAEHLRDFQTQWILHYLTVLERFCVDMEGKIQAKYQEALFDQACMQAELNDRQTALIEQLMLHHGLRDKKSLAILTWYKLLYAKQSKRTQERDFKMLCDKKLVIMIDSQKFKLANEL